MPQSQWSMSQIAPSDSMMFAQTQLRGQHPISSHDMIWTGVPNEPHIEGSMLMNNELLYSHNANQNSLHKATDFSNPSFWLSNGMPITAPSPSADILLSPASPFSDVKHTYSPGPDYSPATPSHSITSYGRSNAGIKISSPGFATPTPQSVIQQRPGSAAMQDGFSASMTSAGAFPVSNTFEDTSMYGSEHSYEQSQISSPCISPWYPPGYVEEKATIARDPQLAFDRSPNPYLAPLERRSRQRQEQWSNKNAIPAQSHFQTRFMAPPTDSEKAQRSEDNKILLDMKRDGYTYRDIRKKLGGKVAESTLRGRYRSLTKPRSARVRSPKWQEIDVRIPRFDEGALTDRSPASADEALRSGRVRQAGRIAAFPREEAEAGQDPLGEDRRPNGRKWWVVQVWRCHGQEGVARDCSTCIDSYIPSTQPSVIEFVTLGDHHALHRLRSSPRASAETRNMSAE
jgi:hypothetical protein